MDHRVSVVEVAAVPTLVVASTTQWRLFPDVWRALSAEVWACLRAAGVTSGARNVMLYLDDRPSVEVGVLSSAQVPLTGQVVRSALPAGWVARTVHRGPYDGLGSAHEAVLDWCAEHGRATTRIRWEVYGPHHDDPQQTWVEVSWLLRD